MPVHAFIFPGQGSQSVGMGRDLAAAFASAREVFEEVDDVLGQKLAKLMFGGPSETLTLTENAQPALMAMSLAVLRTLEREGGFRLNQHAALVAGHSLGEYSALAAAGALSLATTAALLRRRGRAMQAAVPPGDGAMAALLGVEMDEARAICAAAAIRPDPAGTNQPPAQARAAPPPDDPDNPDDAPGHDPARDVVEVANDNGGGQVVISGHAAAVERAVLIARERGLRRAMLLPVSAPFHCALMAPAAGIMREALGEADMAAPLVPVISNVSAAKSIEPDRIRALLVRQVTGTVRWRESLLACQAMGVDSFVELGAGKVLTGLVRRVAPDVAAVNAGTPAEIEALLQRL